MILVEIDKQNASLYDKAKVLAKNLGEIMNKIIAKKVSMLELFYDLVFVYAIAKMTAMIHHPHHGGLSLTTYLQFVLVVIVIIQAWLYQTVYINRFGMQRVIDRGGLLVTMFAMISVANNINTDWTVTFQKFNQAMLVIVLALLAQYFFGVSQAERQKLDVRAFLGVLSVEALLLASGIFLGYTQGLYFVEAGYLVGFLAPLVIYRSFAAENVNFPHLVERLSLLVIITFGEAVVNITSYFTGPLFSPASLLVFLLLLALFGTYTLQIEEMSEQKQQTRGFTLMYSHALLILSLLTLTVSVLFITEPTVSRDFLLGITIFSLLGFYLGTFSNSVYNKAKYRLQLKDLFWFSVIFCLGCFGLFWQKDNTLGFLSFLTLLSLAEYSYTLFRQQKG